MCFNGPQNTFLCLHENICCGYSFKVHGRGSSDEYYNIHFLWRNGEKYDFSVEKNALSG